MKRLFLLLLVAGLLFCRVESRAIDIDVIEEEKTEASLSATPVLVPTVEVKSNIVEDKTSKVEEYKVGKWNGFNSLRVLIAWAMDRGVASNTIVLLLLLPLIATLVSVLHYIGGFSGYGIFMPTMIAVTFLATGIFGGLVLFAMILGVSILSSVILKKLKMHFWPARAISLLFISLATFILMIFSSFVRLIDIRQISIFPILFMILLTEEFTRTQLVKSKNEAKKLTIGTIIVAITGAIVMNFGWFQGIVLRSPELIVVLVLAINLLVGNYKGMRLSEIKRFKDGIREDKK
jgi:uncharacterized protein with transglutaminase domain